jgi:hypothetical protein
MRQREVVRWLLERGARVEARDEQGPVKVTSAEDWPPDARVVDVGIGQHQAAPEDLARLDHLPYLAKIALVDFSSLDAIRPVLRRKEIEFINFWGSHVSQEVMEDVAALPKLGFICVGATNVDDAMFSLLADHPKLVSVDLNGCQITDDGLKVLTTMPRMHRVMLQANLLTERGVQHLAAILDMLITWSITAEQVRSLAALQKLTYLTLGDRVEPSVLAAVAELPGVRHLELFGANDDCLRTLESCRQLSSITIQDGEFAPASLRRLREAMPHCIIRQAAQ